MSQPATDPRSRIAHVPPPIDGVEQPTEWVAAPDGLVCWFIQDFQHWGFCVQCGEPKEKHDQRDGAAVLERFD